MKRISTFKLTLLSGTALILAGCGEATVKEEALVYDSVDACVAAGKQDEAVCKEEFAKAEALHTEVAPRYSGSGECYSDYGQNRCYQHRHRTSGSIWLPFMMGYMLAPRGRSIVSAQPLYRRSSDPNQFYTARYGAVGSVSRDGTSRVAKSQVSKPPVRTRTVARGGFGARATSGRGGRGAGS